MYARYYVGLYMIIYGVIKILGEQFRFPSLEQLGQTYGDSSPMGLLWTFMGYSKVYTFFSGVCEFIGGFLLLFRRTTALGSLISIGVMINVVMMNFCYDIPVKLFSTHLVLISIVILSPDIKRICDFFILHKVSSLTIPKLELTKKWMKIVRVIIKSCIVIGIITFLILQTIQVVDDTKKEAYYDKYNTDSISAKKLNDYPLVKRGFHWINEYPYSR